MKGTDLIQVAAVVDCLIAELAPGYTSTTEAAGRTVSVSDACAAVNRVARSFEQALAENPQ